MALARALVTVSGWPPGRKLPPLACRDMGDNSSLSAQAGEEASAEDPAGGHAARGRLLVASTRGPLSFAMAPDGSLSARRGGGGLVSGLMPGLSALAEQNEVVWICAALSDADREAARRDPDGRQFGIDGDNADGRTAVRALDIAPAIFQGAYNAVANAALWFVQHLMFDTPVQPCFGPDFRRDWQSYETSNDTFAQALEQGVTTAPDQARVLVQDYHLALVPRMLRDRVPGVRIAHFSHTPWAPVDYYRILPDESGRAVLDGILGADHAGFLSQRWASAFLDCCEALLGAQVDRDTQRVIHRGHVTSVGVHPLGVDAPPLRARAHAADVQRNVDALKQLAGDRKIIVRIDRTELSKNILRGLIAYRELLATRPELHGRT